MIFVVEWPEPNRLHVEMSRFFSKVRQSERVDLFQKVRKELAVALRRAGIPLLSVVANYPGISVFLPAPDSDERQERVETAVMRYLETLESSLSRT